MTEDCPASQKHLIKKKKIGGSNLGCGLCLYRLSLGTLTSSHIPPEMHVRFMENDNEESKFSIGVNVN